MTAVETFHDTRFTHATLAHRPTRPMHPWAWWGWALGVAAAATLTTNPLLLALLALAVVSVVVTRRTDDPWARTVGVYLTLAAVVLGVRLLFQVLFGDDGGATVVFRLPQIELPAWAAGIRIGGPVTLEGLLYATYDALRLCVMLLCLGAANALANPKRALRSVPGALYEASVAVVIALSVAPQLIESTQRVRRARRLRGGASTGWRAVRAVVVPVLTDAIDRSLALAAGMDARGFGRTRDQGRPPLGLTAALLGGSTGVTLGVFLLLGSADTATAGAALLLAGAAAVLGGLRASGRRLMVTRYRSDPWTGRDTALALTGGLALAAALLLGSSVVPGGYDALHPSTTPPVWPSLHPLMAVIVAAAATPLALAPMPLPAFQPGRSRR